MTKDPIDPAHYRSGKMQAIEVIEEFNLNFNCGNVVMYVLRAGRKSDDVITDLAKARWYIQKEIDNLREDRERREMLHSTYGAEYVDDDDVGQLRDDLRDESEHEQEDEDDPCEGTEDTGPTFGSLAEHYSNVSRHYREISQHYKEIDQLYENRPLVATTEWREVPMPEYDNRTIRENPTGLQMPPDEADFAFASTRIEQPHVDSMTGATG